ncbi:MFS transporter [Bacillus sp. CLL-7-23]|uniref:MFS transporter n=1 Tax=Bacillus changyiensis TaxID=3004103 RepID=A0ABT4X0C9_9BACI|nr:MFS transporter [Bacillus changyiensis]MDA7025738.1 MFS transporter [Bacillus changyiensis]
MKRDQSKYKWIVLSIATFAQGCATFVTYGTGPLATFYQQSLYLSQFETGIIVSVINIGPIFSMICLGDLMDRYGERWCIGLGAILLGLNISLAYFAQSFFSLLIILLFTGVWYGTAQPGGSSVILKWFPHKNRGMAMGIRQTGTPLGGAIAAITLPTIFFHYGLNGAILGQGLVAMIGGVLFLIFYRDIKGRANRSKDQMTLKEKLNLIKNDTFLYPIFFIGCSMISVQLIIVAHFMSYLNHGLHKSLSESGMLLSVALVGGMCGRMILSWVSDTLFHGNRIKPLKITIWSTAVVMISLAILPYQSNDLLLLSLSFTFGFLGMGWFSLFIVLLSESAKSEAVATTVSVGLTINQLFIVFAPAAFGFAVDCLKSYTVPFFVLACFILVGPYWLQKAEKQLTVSETRYHDG